MSSGRSDFGMLVGIDGSSGSVHALRWAAARTDRFGSIQPLLTWHYPWWAYSAPAPPPIDEFEASAERDAAAAVGSVPGADILPPIVCRAQAGPTIVDVGATANLIVVGTRGRSGLKDALLGSVSSHVVAHATVPVAVVPAGASIDDRTGRVVVGIDGSVNSRAALLWALHHAPAESTIEVVHSWIYPSSSMPGLAVIPYAVHEDRAQYLLDEEVRVATTAVSPGRHRIVRRLEYGDARGVLKEYAESCDLLVVGARGGGGVAHLLLGSVASALVHQPSTTTVVIPVTEH